MNLKNSALLIKKARKEKNLTQKELASLLFVEAKTISKWETGKGFPDLTYVPKLAEILALDLKSLINGEEENKKTDNGNLKRMKIYLCQNCGNLIWSTSSSDISCCRHKLKPVETGNFLEGKVSVEIVDDEYSVSVDHPMEKENYVKYMIFNKDNIVEIVRLYPEGQASAVFPRFRRGFLYIGDNLGHLVKYRIKDNEKVSLISC